MKLQFGKAMLLAAAVSTMASSTRANTVSITFVGSATGVSDGAAYVLPYQLSINGILTNATCYDIFDHVSVGQSWIALELTLSQAAGTGQFSANSDALEGYKQVGFLSQQATNSPQDQINLQHDIWNVFAPGRYSVTTGMQTYLDLLGTSAYTDFDFNRVRFLEDENKTMRAQAFVIDPPTATPEPGTIVLMLAGVLLIGIGRIRKQKLN